MTTLCTAFVGADLFPSPHGRVLFASHVERVASVPAIAAHELDEAGWAAWLRAHSPQREARR